MESLIKQPRVRFSDATQGVLQEAPSIGGGGGRNIPPETERTQSLKEKSKTQNWFQRQFSGSMSKDYDSIDGGDYSAAVAAAAAAYAVNSFYDDVTPKKKVPGLEMVDVSSIKPRAKTEDSSTRMQEPTTSARRSKSLSDMLSGHSFSEPGVPGNSSEKNEGTSTKIKRSKSLTDDSSGSDEKLTSVKKFFGSSSGKAPPIRKKISFDSDLANPKDVKEAETAVATRPSFRKRLTFTDNKPSLKRPQTFADNNTLDGNAVKAGGRETTGLIPGNGFPKPDQRATFLPPPPPQARILGSRADAWERSELAKINKRYEKLRSKIDSWESKKRENAKRQKEKREREIAEKRARVLQHFRREVERIDAVAKGARAETEKKRRKEELKVKEKANRFRTTGKLPPTCFCF